MLHETTETSLRALCEEPNIMYQQISSTLQSGGGGGGEEVRWKTVRTYGKILATPLCGAVLRGHTWVVFRGRAPSRQHSSFGLTSSSRALSNSVSDCEYRIYSNKRRGAYLIFRATSAALIRGRRLF